MEPSIPISLLSGYQGGVGEDVSPFSASVALSLPKWGGGWQIIVPQCFGGGGYNCGCLPISICYKGESGEKQGQGIFGWVPPS